MPTAMLHELLVIVALVIANGVLAGAEIAVVALRSSRARELAERRTRATRALIQLRRDPERFLATVQIGITVIGAAAAAYGGGSFAVHLAPALERAGGYVRSRLAASLNLKRTPKLSFNLVGMVEPGPSERFEGGDL